MQPNKLVRRLRYRTTIALASTGDFTTAEFGGTWFRCRGAYDPVWQTGGGQPRGYDQFLTDTGPYHRYSVISSRIRMSWIPNVVTTTAEANPYFLYGLYFSRSESLPTDNLSAMSQLDAQYEVSKVKHSRWWVGGGDGEALSGKHFQRGPSLTCSARKDLFITRPGDNSHYVLWNQVPAGLWDGLFYPVMFPSRSGLNVGTQYFNIVVEYMVLMVDPIAQHAS